jgi:hypothetical protein
MHEILSYTTTKKTQPAEDTTALGHFLRRRMIFSHRSRTHDTKASLYKPWGYQTGLYRIVT